MEYKGFFDGNKITSGFPILFDCSCSGIQHLSSLCADLTIAKMVNVLPTGHRSDIYSIAAKYVEDYILETVDPKISLYRDDLTKLNINRSIMKIPIMTIPYNISLSGISEKIQSTIVSHTVWEDKKIYYYIKPEFVKNRDSLVINGNCFGGLVKCIFTSLYNIAPPIQVLVKYFTSITKLLKEIDKPIVWVTPSQMHITMSAKKLIPYKTRTRIIKSSPITISIPTNQLDHQANTRAFIANLIHSLDAAHIHNLINKLNQDLDPIPIYTIHDCYATTPYNMEKLNGIVLTTFIKLYFDENYIKIFHRNILEQIKSFGYKIEEGPDGQFIRVSEGDGIIIIPIIPEELIKN